LAAGRQDLDLEPGESVQIKGYFRAEIYRLAVEIGCYSALELVAESSVESGGREALQQAGFDPPGFRTGQMCAAQGIFSARDAEIAPSGRKNRVYCPKSFLTGQNH